MKNLTGSAHRAAREQVRRSCLEHELLFDEVAHDVPHRNVHFLNDGRVSVGSTERQPELATINAMMKSATLRMANHPLAMPVR